jgi:hypothetical protein
VKMCKLDPCLFAEANAWRNNAVGVRKCPPLFSPRSKQGVEKLKMRTFRCGKVYLAKSVMDER